jgi:hypothetical protein
MRPEGDSKTNLQNDEPSIRPIGGDTAEHPLLKTYRSLSPWAEANSTAPPIG